MRKRNSSILALLFLLPVAAARADDRPAAGQPVTPAAATQASTPNPQPRAPSSGAPRRGWLDYAFVGVNGIFQASSWDFSDRLTFTEYVETGESRSSYEVESGPGWSAGGAVRAWRNLAVGVGVTRFTRSGSAEVSASVPHPFFFNQPREVVGSLDDVRREETAVHVSVNWVANVGRHLVVAVGGGPSFFSVKQAFAAMPQWGQTYPFDTATFVGVDSREASANAVGYNVGLDMGFYFTRALGVGIETRYSRARVDMDAPGGALDLDAGGLQVGGGVRVLFPGKVPARKPQSRP